MAINLRMDGTGTIPSPSAMKYGLQDVSAAQSGRTDDAIMHKNRIGQKRKLDLEWSGLTPAQVSTVLQAFNPEYIEVEYWDALDGQYETRTFYVGDRSAPVKIWAVGRKYYEKVSFNIIEQ